MEIVSVECAHSGHVRLNCFGKLELYQDISRAARRYVLYFSFIRCKVWIEKSVRRVTDRHHEACRVMPNSDPSDGFSIHTIRP